MTADTAHNLLVFILIAAIWLAAGSMTWEDAQRQQQAHCNAAAELGYKLEHCSK